MMEGENCNLHREIESFLEPQTREQISLTLPTQTFTTLSNAVETLDAESTNRIQEQMYGEVFISPEGDLNSQIVNKFRVLSSSLNETVKSVDFTLSQEEFAEIYDRLYFNFNLKEHFSLLLMRDDHQRIAARMALESRNLFNSLQEFQQLFTQITGFQVDEEKRSAIQAKLK